MVQGLKHKTSDVIVSDHKPEDEESKRLTFSQAATGASGIETLLSLSYKPKVVIIFVADKYSAIEKGIMILISKLFTLLQNFCYFQ